MLAARVESDTGRVQPTWKPVCAFLAAYGVLVAVVGIAFRTAPAGRATLCLLLIETVAIGVGAPFLWASRRRGSGWKGGVAGILLPLLGLAALTVAACGILAGRLSAPLLFAQVFLLSFALLLTAAAAFLASLRIRATTAQLLATLLALAMISNVLYANPFIERLTGGQSRPIVLRAILWTNPWMIVAGSILQEDPLRATDLYNWSVVKYYGFDYPPANVAATSARALLVTATYAAGALVLWGIARALRCLFMHRDAEESSTSSLGAAARRRQGRT